MELGQQCVGLCGLECVIDISIKVLENLEMENCILRSVFEFF